MGKIVNLLICLCMLTSCYSTQTIVREPQSSYKKQEVVTQTASFVAVGDNLIHSPIYKNADKASGGTGDGKYNFESFYDGVKSDISKADLSFINQETILGGDSIGPKNYPNFNTPSDMASALNNVGFDIVNGCSNHSLDQGYTGLKNSVNTFKKYKNILYTGVFTSQKDYDTIQTIEKNGIKFAVLSYTYGTNSHTASQSYAVSYFSEKKVKSDIKKAKKVADCIIVSAHWGTEYSLKENDEQKKYAQLCADEGVHLVIGTHPHVIQPMKWVEGKNGNKTMVVYSLGNFISTQDTLQTMLEGMFKCDIVKTNDIISIKNVEWVPLVNHFETSINKPLKGNCNFHVYKLSDYSESLAKRHSLNGYNGIVITKKAFEDLTKKVISSEFKVNY